VELKNGLEFVSILETIFKFCIVPIFFSVVQVLAILKTRLLPGSQRESPKLKFDCNTRSKKIEAYFVDHRTSPFSLC
jgi:hypothetical protein